MAIIDIKRTNPEQFNISAVVLNALLKYFEAFSDFSYIKHSHVGF